MAYADWKIHGDDTLAAYLKEDAFKGILEKRIAIPPDLVGILMRDGELVDVYHGANFSVGGVWQRLKEFVGGQHSIRLLVADVKPFPLRCALSGRTKDNVEVQAQLAFEFQLNPETPVDILGLVENDRSLTRSDIYRRIRPHLKERVFTHELVLHEADQLRANTGLQDRIQAEVTKEVERVAGRMGLLVNAVSVNWAQTAEEEQAIKVRELEREEEFEQFEFERSRRDQERQQESTTFQIRSRLDEARLRAASTLELENLLLENQLQIEDARAEGGRLEESKALAHELRIAGERRLATYDERLGDENNELERHKLQLERKQLDLEYQGMTRKQEVAIQRLEQELKADEAKLQHDKLKGLQNLELERARVMNELDREQFQSEQRAKLDEKQVDSQTEVEKLRIQGAMTPDQLLAMQAGLSPEVAKVFSQKASAGAEREGLLREMLELSKTMKADSDAQAQAMFEVAMNRLTDVGKAAARPVIAPEAAHPAASTERGAPAETSDKVECPSCRVLVPATDRFCRNCSHQLRS